MASLSREPNGTYRIQFIDANKKRKSIRLGAVPKKAAESIQVKVENLAALQSARLPMDTETARWVGEIGDDLAAKLAAVGLIPERVSRALGAFTAEYLTRRRKESKPNTVATIERVVNDLNEVFGAGVGLREFTPNQAHRLKEWYQEKGHSGATMHRQLKIAKMLFAHAVREKLIPDNPFADVKVANVTPTRRRHYVSPADAERVIAAAKPAWRVIVALSRYAGLRCPSEVLTLRWADVDLAAGRMTVTSPKTEHIEGKEYRVVPIFAALRPHLEEAFELAEPGTEFVVSGPTGDRFRASAGGLWKNANMRTTFLKIVRRAGLKAWPKPFHNLRASCETDLMRHHPIHVVTAWIGNTPKVAIAHYLQTLDSDFAKAVAGAESGAVPVQNPVQQGAEPKGADGKGRAEMPDISGVLSAPLPSVPLGGSGGTESQYPRQESKPPRGTPEKKAKGKGGKSGGAESGSPDPLHALLATLTPEQRERLAELLNAPPVPR